MQRTANGSAREDEGFVGQAREMFQERTAQTTFRIMLVFLLTNGGGSIISQLFSTYDWQNRIHNIAMIAPVAVLTLALLLVAHRHIASARMRGRIYFAYLIAAYLLAHLINPDKLMTTVNALTVLIVPVLLIQFHRVYALLFFSLHLVSACILFVRMPTGTVALGYGYFIYLVSASMATLYTVLEGIGLFRFYEAILQAHIRTVEQQHEALLAQRQIEIRQSERIRQLAFQDVLTGALNRVGFEEQIDKRLQEGCRRAVIVLVDIFQFKTLNATLGYSAGNGILQRVHEVLAGAPVPFGLIARLGGDEFGIAVFDCDEDPDVLALFSEVRPDLPEELAEFPMRLHAGVSLYPEHGGCALELIQNAETALYVAKTKGPDETAYYDIALHDDMQKRILIAGALEGAMERREITLVYQPTVHAETGRVYGFEALARWNSPRFGHVSPGVFIPIAEQNGSVIRLGVILLEQACSFACRIHDDRMLPGNGQALVHAAPMESPKPIGGGSGEDGGRLLCPVSINVSGVQLLQPQFADRFLETLTGMGTPPAWIGVEVTETAVIQNIDIAHENLDALRRAGVTIYLDDFGTGYSSLNYLSRLPVDFLKIDRSFVKQSMHSRKGTRMIHSIVDLARHFELGVIVEGVEDQEQADAMQSLGCRLIQGYHYARPMNEDAAMDFLSRRGAARVSGPSPHG